MDKTAEAIELCVELNKNILSCKIFPRGGAEL